TGDGRERGKQLRVRSAATFAIPGGPIGVGSLAFGVAGLSVALGALPLPAAAAVAIGIPTVVLSIAIPRLALLLLLFSIPFSSFTKVTVGAFDVTSTDVLVGFIMAVWVVRSIAE